VCALRLARSFWLVAVSWWSQTGSLKVRTPSLIALRGSACQFCVDRCGPTAHADEPRTSLRTELLGDLRAAPRPERSDHSFTGRSAQGDEVDKSVAFAVRDLAPPLVGSPPPRALTRPKSGELVPSPRLFPN